MGLTLSLAIGVLFACPPAGAARGKNAPRKRTHGAGRASSPASQKKAGGQPAQPKSQPQTPSQLSNAYAALPIGFEANQGQTDASVKFLSRGDGFNLFLTEQEAVVVLHRPQAAREPSHKAGATRPHARPSSSEAVRMKLAGANPRPDVHGLGELPGKSSYLVGRDPAGWRTSIPSYAKVKYREVYPGVDAIYYGNQRQLEYDFVVAPGSSADVIRLSFEGARGLRIDDRGDLVLRMRGGELRQSKPFVYQEAEDGTRREIEGRYVLAGRSQVRFAIGSYDRTKPLVIDPALSYSTYLGGSGADYGRGIVADSAGNIYVAGYTQSTNFPTAGALQPSLSGTSFDAFVLKLNGAGTALLYSTYLGGDNNDFGLALAVDIEGRAYVAGETLSTNFPAVNAAQGASGGGTNDAFVAKLNASGTGLVYSTYLGGSGGGELAQSIALDGAGNAYVVGYTQSTNFPTANAFQTFNRGGVDAFVTKLSPAGSFAYSTYLGGAADDWALAVAVDSAANVYLTGETISSNFPLANAYQPSSQGLSHAFVTKLDASGASLVYSTYLGGGGPEAGHGIAVDADGNAYVAGETWSTNFPTVNPAQAAFGGGVNDGFVSKLNPAGTGLVYSTYLGGGSDDWLRGLAIDAAGHAYVTGETVSTNFPTVNPLQQKAAGSDGFVTKLSPSGNAFAYSTYVGGNNNEMGWEIAAEPAGHKAYVVGWTFSTDFPAAGPFQPAAGGSSDVFILRLTGYSIGGRVTDAAGTGYGSVTIALGGSQARSTQTDADGFYSFSDVPAGGNYTVAPSGLTSTPASQTFNNLSDDRTANFSVTTHSISGRVRDAGGAGVAAVNVQLTGSQALSTQTDPAGFYSFPNVVAGGSYNLTPSKADLVQTYTFAPAAQSFNALSTNQTADFTSATSVNNALFPVADAYVQDGTSAAANFGAATTLLVQTDTKTNTGLNRDAYLKFDIGGVTSSIGSVKLRVFAALSAAGSVSTSAHGVSSTSWAERGTGGVTWNTKPARNATAIAGATVAVTSTAYRSYDIDVTTYVKAEKAAGRDAITLALHNASASSPHISINSREAGSNRPQLLVATSSNAAPVTSLTAPSAGANFTAPAAVTLSASATDGDGTVSKVDFYAGTTLVGTATAGPSYQTVWGNVGAGSYTLTAVATDSGGATSASSPVSITVSPPNNSPSASLNFPLDGGTFAAGSQINLVAGAADKDGTVSKVEFFAGTTLVGTATTPTSPGVYDVQWNNAPAGAHTLTARATDNLGASGTSAAVAVNVVSQTGLSPAADTYVRDGTSAAANFGTAAEMQTQVSAAAGSNRESYLKFDLTSVAGIADAKLRLYGRLSDLTGGNVPASVYAVSNTSWAESGTGGINWNTKPVSAATALAAANIIDNNPRWYEFDVSAYVKNEKAAGRNLVSFAVKNTAASTAFATFNTREAAANRPQLLLRTTAARTALLVVGSATLGAGDSAVRTRLQNLGYTVTVKAAGSTTNSAVNTSDADGKSLVVISSTVTPANVAAKFRNVAVPVVNWEFDLSDDLGMTGAVSGTDYGTAATQTQLSIVNGAHPLAAGLSGTVAVSASSSFSWGKPNANASKVATLSTDATKVAVWGYEAGALMPGLEAPARRVGLFLTDTTAATTTLNANGGALFDAAVRWAAETVTAPTVAGLTPTSGPNGASVTITGLNFGATQGTSALTFNGVTAAPSAWGNGRIVATVPQYATTGPVVVTVGGVASNGLLFAVGETDVDGDGLPDAWEMQHFGNLGQNAGGDADGDGLTNLQEYQQGRNPTKSALADEGDFVGLKVHTPLRP